MKSGNFLLIINLPGGEGKILNINYQCTPGVEYHQLYRWVHPCFCLSSSLFIFVKVLITKMINTQPQRTSASSKRRKSRRKSRPLSTVEDKPMDKIWKDELECMFYKDVDEKYHHGYYIKGEYHEGYDLWILKPGSNIWRLKLKLSWVMGSRALELSHNEVLREIVSRFKQHDPEKWEFWGYSDTCFSNPHT